MYKNKLLQRFCGVRRGNRSNYVTAAIRGSIRKMAIGRTKATERTDGATDKQQPLHLKSTTFSANLLCDCYKSPNLNMDPVDINPTGKLSISIKVSVLPSLKILPADLSFLLHISFALIVSSAHSRHGTSLGDVFWIFIWIRKDMAWRLKLRACRDASSTLPWVRVMALLIQAIQKSNSYHKKVLDASCEYGATVYNYMLLFGAVQIVVSHIPDFHSMAWLSIVATTMSFSYSFIGLELGVAAHAGNVKRKERWLVLAVMRMYMHILTLPTVDGTATEMKTKNERLKKLLVGEAGEGERLTTGLDHFDDGGLEFTYSVRYDCGDGVLVVDGR
ncbi:hypothetical protein Vadar_032712 [Vaccinium darrowii]|uniref:Uncharacterized protein n=1 Tax=Vaccinium darrowii TaxID=229202 RepID=A0ACB7X5V0_9ERIC|nr:hypothetical protein Vadar_032712 [Vaccinium darrowii]